MTTDEFSPYCDECGSCGETGCCSPLLCAEKNMVDKGCGDHCEINFKDIVLMYKIGVQMYDASPDPELFDRVYTEVYNVKEGE